MRNELRSAPSRPVRPLRAALVLLLSAGAAGGEDTDGDGVRDVLDNCLIHPNASQCDSNQDGYGNRCDGDIDDDGDVDMDDYFSCPGPSVCDLDCDGVVSGADLASLAAMVGGTPGPSGLSCAGTIPCLAPIVPVTGAAGALLLALLVGASGIALRRRLRGA